MPPRKKSRMQWYRMDLHLHTPASADYQEPEVSFIDVLRKAEFRGLDIVAFTDHNTVNGFVGMMREIDQLAFLEQLGRAQQDELRLLAEYRRLLDKVLVLPGFEFTATFGFHVLGIFSPSMPLRQLEHLLLTLNIPADTLDTGSTTVGASADVLTAYRVIHEAGGICIAAHVNSSHGVAMKGFDFGGQTRIAYTQDLHLHALEVTDLGRKTRTSTERFFDGTKPEYPRRMRCIQGSDAHRLNASDKTGKNVNLGIGDRVTEVMLTERTFPALLEMFQSSDFSRSRPYSASRQKPYDYVQAAREGGPTLVQSFHESAARRGGHLYSIIADVCGFANTNGGTIYVGLDAEKKKPPLGIENVQETVDLITSEISSMITPTLEFEIDTLESQSKAIVRIQVPLGSERPYAIEDNKIYVRDEEADTSLAVRDEIVNLVLQGISSSKAPVSSMHGTADTPLTQNPPLVTPVPTTPPPQPSASIDDGSRVPAPRAGVEIIGTEQRNGVLYHVMRDLRNGSVVKNVTRASARRLWHYAILEKENSPVDAARVQWHGDVGMWKRYQRSGETRFDLVQREDGRIRVYYGVTDSGMHGPWQVFIPPEDED